MDSNNQAGADAPLKFIRDVAADKDFFGSHEKVARTIGDVLRSNEEIKVIGLLGPWGSGKSTVVGLLRDYLKKEHSETDLVFSYDAWLHQSDPPRRAFLETMLHFLIEEDLTQEDSWSEKLDVLNRRTEDSVTTTTPRLTFPGTVMVLSLLLIPFGLKFASLEWYKAVTDGNVPHASWFFFGGLGSIAVPVLLAIAFYAAWRPTLKFWKAGFWKRWNWERHRKPHQHESILSLFMNRETKTNFNRVTKDPEPTAIEFQDAFREAMEIATSSNRRFIIVIDNLDRLPESEAVALWATIRSFFLGADGGLRSRRGRRQPVVILPIAEDAIERLYAAAKDDARALARSFMEKTFDLTFHVNRPVLTQWTSFLEHQMKHIFGASYDDAWAFVTGRLYERYSAMDGSPVITPRGINTLVNAIGTRWLQWRGTVKFASVAYYCTFRESIEKNIVQAAASPLAPIGEYDDQWQNSIAALYYGVKPGDAAQILLDQPLRRALLGRDASAFATLAQIPSFYLILHRIVESNKSEADADVLFNTAHLLSAMRLDHQSVVVRQIWSLLRGTLPNIQQLKSFNDFASDGLLGLFAACPPEEIKGLLGSSTTLLASTLIDAGQSEEFSAAFTKYWLGVTTGLASYDLLPDKVFVPGRASVFGDVALRFVDTPSLAGRLTTNASPQDIAAYIADFVTISDSVDQAERRIAAIDATGLVVDWTRDLERMIGIVRAPITSPQAMASALLILGMQIPSKGVNDNVYQGLIADGTLVTRLNEAFAQKFDLILARVLAHLILLGKPFALPEAGQWPAMLSERKNFIEQLDSALATFCGQKLGAISPLVMGLKASPDLKMIAVALLSRRVEAGALGRLNVKGIFDDPNSYLNLLPTTELKEEFVVLLTDYETFWKHMAERSLDETSGELFQILINQESTADNARRNLQDRLLSESTDTWEKGILSGSRTLNLGLELLKIVPDLPEVPNVYTALDGTLSHLIDGAEVARMGRWFDAAQLVGEDARTTVFKNLRDRINSGTPVVGLASLVKTGGRELLIGGQFADESDESVRHVVLPLISADGGVAVLESIDDVAREWLDRADASTRSVLVAQLDMLEGASEGTVRQGYQRLRQRWSLPPLEAIEGNSDAEGGTT